MKEFLPQAMEPFLAQFFSHSCELLKAIFLGRYVSFVLIQNTDYNMIYAFNEKASKLKKMSYLNSSFVKGEGTKCHTNIQQMVLINIESLRKHSFRIDESQPVQVHSHLVTN